jgi:predicted nucleic acid-binding Zn ribbon protein
MMGRRPRPISEALIRFQATVAPATLLGDVQRSWQEAAGQTVADRAEPVSERDGVVTMRCDAAVWAAELTMLAPRLCDQLNTLLGGGRRVRGLKFTLGPR